MMDELLEQFLLESRDLVAQATADFSVLARQPHDAEAIDSAFRAMHTLKGSVAIFAMVPAEQLLHAAEDILETAKRNSHAIGAETLAALVMSIDQIDRWIDDMERVGDLPAKAAADAQRLIAQLPGLVEGTGKETTLDVVDLDDWVKVLSERMADFIRDRKSAVTAFRYTPDADCFFRGEDPLALALAVPELLTLNLSPAGGEWPNQEAMEPFACVTVLEGISAADLQAVSTAFRTVPDQIAVASIFPPKKVAANGQAARGAGLLRVSVSRVDALADGLGELIVAVNAMAGLAQKAAKIDRALASEVQAIRSKLDSVTERLQRELGAVRAVALETSLRRLPRLVREIAESLGKEVTFSINGGEIEVDKQIADGLFEPLLHLLRNAVDHGAEESKNRLAAGKAEECAISLHFARSGDNVEVVLSDDGGGIDAARVREKAILYGLMPAENAAALSDAEALNLIFLPGFSMAEQVTAISGRGVGMDAVQAAIRRLRGTLSIESALGRGTTFRIHLPVSALTTPLLIVRVGEERYGIPLDQILETARVEESALRPVGTGQACVRRGRTVPVLDLDALLGTAERDNPLTRMLITQVTGDRVALRVDGFGERLDAFVRPPAGMLAAVPGVVGFTLMGDGSVLLVLDLSELLS